MAKKKAMAKKWQWLLSGSLLIVISVVDFSVATIVFHAKLSLWPLLFVLVGIAIVLKSVGMFGKQKENKDAK